MGVWWRQGEAESRGPAAEQALKPSPPPPLFCGDRAAGVSASVAPHPPESPSLLVTHWGREQRDDGSSPRILFKVLRIMKG